MMTSTPNLSQEKVPLNESGLSIVEQPPSPPLLLTDSSVNESQHECSLLCSSSHQADNVVVEKGEEEISERNVETKELSKDRESGEEEEEIEEGRGVGNDQLIGTELMECDCDENQDKIETPSIRKEVLKKVIIDKELARKETKQCSLPSTAKIKTEETKNRHVTLAQITSNAKSTENSFYRKGIRKVDAVVDKRTKTSSHSNDDSGESGIHESVIPDSISEAAHTHALEKKLLATMQILKNKEETVRVQAESLALAEARIAALSAKAAQSSQKHHQAQQTPTVSTRSSSVGSRVSTSDAHCDVQAMEQRVVCTLRDNLSVIEELYRECFYESAKQEELVTMLRGAYLTLRETERQQSQQIGQLQRVVHSQRCSLERCQDIAMEVENLKTDITNFLNNSQNNDSGVWEREEEGADVTEELRTIAQQLRRLRDMLHTDCTCGLEEENTNLKRINETMQMQVSELRQRVHSLEETLDNKKNMDQQYQAKLKIKDRELQQVKVQMVALEERSRDQEKTCDALNCTLKKMEVAIKEKSLELAQSQQQAAEQESNLRELRDQLCRAGEMAQENGNVREEVSCLSAQVQQWRAQLAATRRRLRALEAELQRARDHCRHLAEHYREKSQLAEELQSQLEEAQTRGATLCGEARRAVCGVRHWLHRQRQRTREQEEKIKQQQLLIQTLQGATKAADHTAPNDNDPCCSKYVTCVEARRSDHSFVSASETGCSKCASSKVFAMSESERGSSPAPPTPPRRLLRKKPLCGDIRCQWPATRDAAAQRPARSDAGVGARDSTPHTPDREVTSTDELLERVERAHEALADAHRRWTRGAPARDGA